MDTLPKPPNKDSHSSPWLEGQGPPTRYGEVNEVKRFPDIIVISWQCECGQYMTESIDISNINVDRVCEKCRMSYTVAIGEIDVEVEVTARTRREDSESPSVNSLSSQ